MMGTILKHGAAIARPEFQDYVGKYRPKDPDYVGKFATQPPKALPVVRDAMNRRWDVISLSPEAQLLLQGKLGHQKLAQMSRASS